MLQQCVCRETMETCGYYAEWSAKHVCDGGQCWCLKVKRLAMMAGGRAWWMGKHQKKVAWGWGMVMVGYAKIGNMGRNLYRVMMWHLWGVEGYDRRVELGMEGEFRKGGEGRLCGLAKGDVMMRRGIVLLYPSHSRPLASLIFSFIPRLPPPFQLSFPKKNPRRKQSTIEFGLQGWWLAGIAHSGTSKKGSGFEPSGVQVKHLPVLCEWASLGGANCLSRRVCRCASKEKIIELLEAHWKREREREREKAAVMALARRIPLIKLPNRRGLPVPASSNSGVFPFLCCCCCRPFFCLFSCLEVAITYSS